MSIKKNKTEKYGTNFDPTTNFVIENIEGISVNFKICIPHFFVKNKHKPRRLNKVRQYSAGQI